MADVDDRKKALTAELASRRAKLTQTASGMRESLEVNRRFKQSFAAHRWIWLGAAVVFGLILTARRPRRASSHRRKIEVRTDEKRGHITLTALKFLFDILKPLLVPLLSARLADLVARQARSKRDH